MSIMSILEPLEPTTTTTSTTGQQQQHGLGGMSHMSQLGASDAGAHTGGLTQMPSLTSSQQQGPSDAPPGRFSALSGFNIWSNGAAGSTMGGGGGGHSQHAAAAAAVWGNSGIGTGGWNPRSQDTMSMLPSSLLPVNLELDMPPTRQPSTAESTLRAAAPAYYGRTVSSTVTPAGAANGYEGTAAAFQQPGATAWGDPRAGSGAGYGLPMGAGFGGPGASLTSALGGGGNDVGGDYGAGSNFSLSSGMFSVEDSRWGMGLGGGGSTAPAPWAQYGGGQQQQQQQLQQQSQQRPGAWQPQRHGSVG